MVSGQNPKYVFKIKTGHTIKEIVFEYINGQYLIWEINAQWDTLCTAAASLKLAIQYKIN